MINAIIESTELSNAEKEYLLLLMEASLEEQLTDEEKDRLKDFKKRYKAHLDSDGNGIIKLNNELVKVHSKTSGDVASSDIITDDLNIHMRKFLKIPDAKDREAILQHEFGHRKLHTVNMRGGVVDLKRIDDELREQIKNDLLEMLKGNGEPEESKLEKKIIFHAGMRLPDEAEDIQKAGLIEKRKAFRDKLRPLVVSNSHATLNEFEADQYAANKVGAKRMIHALRTMDGLDDEFDNVNIDEDLNKLRNDRHYKNKSEKERERLEKEVILNNTYLSDLIRRIHKKETDAREKALKNKDIDSSVRKSLTD